MGLRYFLKKKCFVTGHGYFLPFPNVTWLISNNDILDLKSSREGLAEVKMINHWSVPRIEL